MGIWDNEHNLEILKAGWAEGLTGLEISERIPGSTRSSVIAKARKLGLASRKNNANQRYPYRSGNGCTPGRSRTAARRVASSSKAPSRSDDGELHPFRKSFNFGAAVPRICDGMKDLEPTEVDPPQHEQVELVDLRADQCRWPIGSPTLFCGRKTLGTYCEAHAARAFNGKPGRPAKPGDRRHLNKFHTGNHRKDATNGTEVQD